MAALARSGRSAEPLAVYRQARGVLVEELGLDPGPQLQEVHRRVLDGTLAATASAPDPARPGAGRPRAVAGPVVSAPAASPPAASAAPRSVSAVPPAGQTAALDGLTAALFAQALSVLAADGTPAAPADHAAEYPNRSRASRRQVRQG